jgi:hypothetical protein
VSDPDRKIAVTDGDTPAPAPKAKIDLAPDGETAQRNPGQPCSATDLLNSWHGTPLIFKTGN